MNWVFYLPLNWPVRPAFSIYSSQFSAKYMLPNERTALALTLQADIESPCPKGSSAQAVRWTKSIIGETDAGVIKWRAAVKKSTTHKIPNCNDSQLRPCRIGAIDLCGRLKIAFTVTTVCAMHMQGTSISSDSV